MEETFELYGTIFITKNRLLREKIIKLQEELHKNSKADAE